MVTIALSAEFRDFPIKFGLKKCFWAFDKQPFHTPESIPHEVPADRLHEEVEKQALARHGYPIDREGCEAYRRAAKALTLEARSEIFFLKANDQLFRPGVNLVGKRPNVDILDLNLKPLKLQDALPSSKTLLVASTSS